MLHVSEAELKKALTASGFVDEKDFEKAYMDAKSANRETADILIEKGILSEEYLAKIMADYSEMPYLDLKSGKIDKDTLFKISENYAKSHHVAAVAEDDNSITIAMIDPMDLKTVQFLEHQLKKSIKPAFVTHQGLKQALTLYEINVDKEFDKIINENVGKAIQSGTSDAQQLAQDLPVISILETLIEYASSEDASDIHIESLVDQTLIRFRVDGVLQDILWLPIAVHTAILARVKLIADLKIDEHRLPQDGRFKYETDEASVSIRVSIVPTIYGEKIVMRLLSDSSRPLNLEALGFDQKQQALLDEQIKKTHGMILSTGPTGCGKTTSLYTIMHLLNKPEVNISTIEDPVEYDIKRINQIQVNTKTGLGFSDGLRSLLRQDPDIIMVGEIRDGETAELAVHAALTGHLVLSTLHTNSAAGAIPRIIDIGVQPFLLASTVNLIIAQRLVRRICTKCNFSKKISEKEAMDIFKHLGIEGSDIKKYKSPNMAYMGKGCDECHGSGFKGQIGIFEVLVVNDNIRNLIIDSAPETKIHQSAVKNGMITMLQDGLNKAASGLTTYEEIMRVIRE
ncbi:hypothetical protein AUK11_02475 [bacterium CG2_30_37_16]|nr:MAG: hypothetical protein AUK11_02475 [bacterium CG2_30_37_16]PIP30275.1 MAG: hypothetical protein COX25_05625 [bacterium (Candidatus Howlettbacteria) CG23_combo_of_CG06-09_8_20_14_all_37_9]PIY00107.1 MAG: hypothetical protein COZ22_01175 [bacterium (Candidatus Howlettbacteria) CG_4_10_14_3_um_filter_37_10]PJB06568.1 MAG: hypothetical protein CO123_01980 [bacterium (Candidatus Howlettbacteria) CG_4_9_14_3_um_filter_37_10]